MSGPERAPAGGRQVLLLGVVIVAVVLGLQLVSLLVPAVGEVFGVAPLLIGVLVLGTALVLAGALRPR
jgi:hypothetical protein